MIAIVVTAITKLHPLSFQLIVPFFKMNSTNSKIVFELQMVLKNMYTVLVANLPYRTTFSDMHRLFTQVGFVAEINVQKVQTDDRFFAMALVR